MKDREEEIINYFLKDELKAIHSYLPRKRKTLTQLLQEEYPHVQTRDGGVHMFRRSELKYANELLGKESDDLLLPTYLEMRPEFTQTVAILEDATAIKLVSKILDVPPEKPLYLYPVHIEQLRRKIGTLIYYLISPRSFTEVK